MDLSAWTSTQNLNTQIISTSYLPILHCYSLLSSKQHCIVYKWQWLREHERGFNHTHITTSLWWTFKGPKGSKEQRRIWVTHHRCILFHKESHLTTAVRKKKKRTIWKRRRLALRTVVIIRLLTVGCVNIGTDTRCAITTNTRSISNWTQIPCREEIEQIYTMECVRHNRRIVFYKQNLIYEFLDTRL